MHAFPACLQPSITEYAESLNIHTSRGSFFLPGLPREVDMSGRYIINEDRRIVGNVPGQIVLGSVEGHVEHFIEDGSGKQCVCIKSFTPGVWKTHVSMIDGEVTGLRLSPCGKYMAVFLKSRDFRLTIYVMYTSPNAIEEVDAKWASAKGYPPHYVMYTSPNAIEEVDAKWASTKGYPLQCLHAFKGFKNLRLSPDGMSTGCMGDSLMLYQSGIPMFRGNHIMRQYGDEILSIEDQANPHVTKIIMNNVEGKSRWIPRQTEVYDVGDHGKWTQGGDLNLEYLIWLSQTQDGRVYLCVIDRKAWRASSYSYPSFKSIRPTEIWPQRSWLRYIFTSPLANNTDEPRLHEDWVIHFPPAATKPVGVWLPGLFTTDQVG